MPLIHSPSKKAFEHNVKTEVHAGKPAKQAVAIAYSEKGEHKMADGGDVDEDHETIMDQVADEMMRAIENKNKDQLLECFHVLVADMMQKMSGSEKEPSDVA